MPRREMLRHLVAACDAVAYAHSRGVIHRDLKPHNIMIGHFGETVVIDWGLAKVVGDRDIDELSLVEPIVENQATRGRAGTPSYMSPEQARECVDDRSPAPSVGYKSDIYGLGATLYTLLTGDGPFAGVKREDIYRRVLNADYPRLRQRDSSIPRSLEAIALKAMSLNADQRYDDVISLRNDLQAWIDDKPVAAYSEGLGERLFRWMRHHQATAAVFIACLLFLGLFAILRVGQISRENFVLLSYAASLQELGGLNFQTDNREAARQCHETQVEIMSKLYAREKTAERWLGLIQAKNERAYMTHKSAPPQSSLEPAQALYDETEAELDAFERKHGVSLESQRRRMILLGDRGLTDLQVDGAPAAIKAYNQAIDIGDDILRNAAIESSLKEEVLLERACALGNLGDAFDHQARSANNAGSPDLERQFIEQEIDHRRECVDICLNLDADLIPQSVMSVQVVRLGFRLIEAEREPEAIDVLLQAMEQHDTIEMDETYNPVQQVSAAICFAALARQEKHPDLASALEGRAIQTLKQALSALRRASGRSFEAELATKLDSPLLRNLRSRPDFQTIVAEMKIVMSAETKP